MIRAELMNVHKILSLGSPEDMLAARLILRLLRAGRITLGLSDVEWQVQILLENMGINLMYSSNGNWARAQI